MLVLERSYVQFFLSAGTLHAKWIGFVTTVELRAGLEAGLDLVIKNKLKCWLADVADMEAIDPEFLDWHDNNWLPRIVSAGVKRMAFIESKDIFNQALIETGVAEAAERVKDSMTTKYFRDKESAVRWLQEEFAQ